MRLINITGTSLRSGDGQSLLYSVCYQITKAYPKNRKVDPVR